MRPGFFKNRDGLVRHGLSLLVSLVIHAVVIAFLAVFFVSVKVMHFGRTVTDVMIVPAEKLHLPRFKGELPDPQDWGAQFPELSGRRTRPLPAAARDAGKAGAPPELQSSPASPPGNPHLATEFSLDTGLPARAGGASDQSAGFSLPQGTASSPGGLAVKRVPSKAVDFRQYIYGNRSSAAGLSAGIYYGDRVGGRPGRGRAPVAASVINYDLSPWARQAIAQIQKNWMIPSIQATGSAESVEIAVVVLKNGAISSAEILAPSENKRFNQAALEAVESSSPLPPLPGDFPAASLEVSFIFAKQT
jgi:TonB family protein